MEYASTICAAAAAVGLIGFWALDAEKVLARRLCRFCSALLAALGAVYWAVVGQSGRGAVPFFALAAMLAILIAWPRRASGGTGDADGPDPA